MPPHYERCGDIIWQSKRESRTFAFKCIFCGQQSTAFTNFKQHLEIEHSDQMELKGTQLHSSARKKSVSAAALLEREQVAELESELQKDPLEKNDDVPELNVPDDSHTTVDSASENTHTDTATSEKSDMSSFWMLQHPIMLTLIDQYKAARLLWDVGMLEYYNNKRREDACEQIASHLNAKYDLQLKGHEIADYTKKVRSIFAEEQRRVERNESEMETKWYWEHLSFLCPSVSRKRSFRLARECGAALPVPQLTDEQNVKFIELYQRCNRLWDMQDVTCRLRHVRIEAKEKLLQLCRNELVLPLEPVQLQRYIKYMRSAYAQEKTRRFECKRKGVEYTPQCRYQEQLQFLDDHMPPFQCKECGELLSSMDSFKVHCSEHEHTMPFMCPFCQRGFMRSDNCIMHVRRHTQNFHLACKECDKRFANTTDLQVHQRRHTGEKPYCCDVCGSCFRTSSFFERHKRRHEQRPTGKCDLCGKVFYESSMLNDHIKAHLNVRDKKCDVCNKSFTSAKYLRQHKEIHANHKRYICKICGKGFAQYAGLSGHIKSHGTSVRGVAKEENSKATSPQAR